MARSNDSKTKATGQKFIARNRAPRVQIEYDVEIYGSEHKVEIPFVMGVVADLAGQSTKPLPDLEQRKFLEIDIDNFDERLKSIQPQVALHVPNDISGDGMLAVELSFESMEDFSPAAIAKQVPALDQLLGQRIGRFRSQEHRVYIVFGVGLLIGVSLTAHQSHIGPQALGR